MTADRKRHFLDALLRQYREALAAAGRAEADAASGADRIGSEATRREDAKGAVELARLARGHRERRLRAEREIEVLSGFAATGLRRFGRESRVDLGALVDVRIEGEAGAEERTLFVLPVGAGSELEGPGGDGFVFVVTPTSPVGRALLGGRIGDSFEIVVGGQDREWTIVDIA